MSAIFDFPSLIIVILLLICTCSYLREMRPTVFDFGVVKETGQGIVKRNGVSGFCWKLSRVGERLSPFIGISCAVMALHVLFIKK